MSEHTKQTAESDSNVGEMQNEGARQAKSAAAKPNFNRFSAISRVKNKLKELKEHNAELKDKYLRLYADFDNYKKRTAREWIEKNKEAGKEVITDLLPVIDDFERALKTLGSTDKIEAVREGSELIYGKLKRTLEQKGLQQMEAKGADFDPEKHEAITEIPAPSEKEKGKVIDEIEKGYLLNGKIIRYAKVVVGK